MNLARMLAVTVKEWREIVRDRLFFALAFLVPALLMLLFGYGLSFDVENIPFAIADYDRTAQSRDYAYRFISSRYFDFRGYSGNETDLARRLTKGELRAYLVIPPQFGRTLLSGRAAHVQTIIDGTFPMRAGTISGYVSAINAAHNTELVGQALQSSRGLSTDETRQLLSPIVPEMRYLYNEAIRSVWSIAPKLIMVLMMVSPPFLSALGIVREKERGSIYNIYASTVSRSEFLLGKIAPYVAICMLNVVVLWCVATMIFGAPFKGSLAFFFLGSLAYVSCTTGIGLTVSAIVRTQVASMVLTTIVTVIPAVLYSGVIIPVPSLSGEAQVIAHLLPAMYYTDIVTGTFLKGLGFQSFWRQLLILVSYAGVLLTIGLAAFTKRPAR